MDYKPLIIEHLQKLKQKETAQNEKWKARAYDKVIKNLKAHDKPITKIEDVDEVAGVGEKIRAKIKEIIETGDLAQTKNISKDIETINELTKVFGIGPVRAKELVTEHNIKSIEDLEKNKDILNDKQIIGLKYYKDFEKRIPRTEMDKHRDYIFDIVKKIDSKISVEIMGSYRRQLKDSGDIDIIIKHQDDDETVFQKVCDKLVKEKYLVDTFAYGAKKYNGVGRLKRHRTFRRVDVMFTPKKMWAFALLYFTGSQAFNIVLRTICLEKGYTLNEYGLRYTSGERKGQFVDEEDFDTEEEVFKFLGLEYVSPENRTGKIIPKSLVKT